MSHLTRRFFNVVGVKSFSVPDGRKLFQPIIDQSEIGLLSFLVHKQDEEWWILAHAKVEPGNVNGAQIAPTVQATKSNYEAAHGGCDTDYLDKVQFAEKTLYNQLQSEQNSRFLAKRNRNSVILLGDKVKEINPKFKWIRISELLPLLGESHAINTDARSVLICWLFTDLDALRQCMDSEKEFAMILLKSFESGAVLNQNTEIEEWLSDLNNKWNSKTEVVPLREIGSDWKFDESTIVSSGDNPLKVYQIKVSCLGREVSKWDQPIVGSKENSILILFIGLYQGTLHLLVQARLEAGNREGFEFTTTVQGEASYINEYEKKLLQAMEKKSRVLRAFDNSEEGGRFDQCISEYKICWVDDVKKEYESPFHRWISVSQFSDNLRMKNRITNELRSAASSLLSLNDL